MDLFNPKNALINILLLIQFINKEMEAQRH